MCKKDVKRTPFRYKPDKFVSDWEPEELTVCRLCVYKEAFGSKFYRKKMKEGVLDGKK